MSLNSEQNLKEFHLVLWKSSLTQWQRPFTHCNQCQIASLVLHQFSRLQATFAASPIIFSSFHTVKTARAASSFCHKSEINMNNLDKKREKSNSSFVTVRSFCVTQTREWPSGTEAKISLLHFNWHWICSNWSQCRNSSRFSIRSVPSSSNQWFSPGNLWHWSRAELVSSQWNNDHPCSNVWWCQGLRYCCTIEKCSLLVALQSDARDWSAKVNNLCELSNRAPSPYRHTTSFQNRAICTRAKRRIVEHCLSRWRMSPLQRELLIHGDIAVPIESFCTDGAFLSFIIILSDWQKKTRAISLDSVHSPFNHLSTRSDFFPPTTSPPIIPIELYTSNSAFHVSLKQYSAQFNPYANRIAFTKWKQIVGIPCPENTDETNTFYTVFS